MYSVDIEFKRVQTYLFDVPRLKDMLGANAIIGELIRKELPELANKNDSRLPELNEEIKKEIFSTLPSLDKKDPLICKDNPSLNDNPAEQYNRGILKRDGGHLTALFANDTNADNFASEAQSLILQKAPGLMFSVAVRTIGDKNSKQLVVEPQPIIDLPQFQVCEESGHGPATYTKKISIGGDDKKTLCFGRESQGRKKKAQEFYNNETKDIIGLLTPKLPHIDKKNPEDFHALCDGDYLAVITADGNAMGSRLKGIKDKKEKTDEKIETVEDYLLQESKYEKFWHGARVTIRKAVVQALKETFKDYKGVCLPYRLLMLGGDDLLLVCQAHYALPFVKNYALALKETQPKCSDQTDKEIQKESSDPITVGVGVAIASPSLPFHRLHHLAEELAGSAKRLYRSGVNKSVIDWMVCTSSWSDDPISIRKRDDLIRYRMPDGTKETLILSAKPYPILSENNKKSETDKEIYKIESLQDLMTASGELKNNKAARSQLRWLIDCLGKGKRFAELAFAEMASETKNAINNAVAEETPWLKSDNNTELTYNITHLKDLIEITEIERLGQKVKQAENSTQGEIV